MLVLRTECVIAKKMSNYGVTGHILVNFDWAPIFLHLVVNMYIVYKELKLRNLKVGAQYIFLYTKSS